MQIQLNKHHSNYQAQEPHGTYKTAGVDSLEAWACAEVMGVGPF